MRRVREGCFDGIGEIELSVAVGIRTGELEERPCRRMQYVRLQCRCARGRTLELQLETQMLGGLQCAPQRQRACPVATQPVHPLLAGSGAETCGVHVALPVVGSRGVAEVSTWLFSGFSPRAPGRADRRCCFSCWRALRASSFCFLA